MKNTQKTLVALSALVLSASFPEAAIAQSIACPQPLLFGDIIPCGVTNTVVVTPSNTRSVNSCLSAGGAPFSRGRCLITQSPPFRPVQISMSAATVTLTNGTANMSISNFNIMTNLGGSATTVAAAPAIQVPIGATLTVGINQASGTYSGSVVVNATLQ